MKIKSKSVLIFLLIFASVVNAQNATEIIKKMEDKMRGDKAYMEVSMQIVRPKYTRELSMKSWTLGEDYSLILITAPARDNGIAYLKRQKEIWNWMPSIDRLIKLPPSMMSQSWMGSDFTNDDLVRESSTIDDYTHKLLRKEQKNGYECHVIELVPKPNAPIVWGKVVVWVADVHFFQLRAEHYDERMQLVSYIDFSEVKNLGGREIPSKMEMVPVDKKGHKTILIHNVADFNPNINEDFFSIQNLKRVR
jgi:outer membrane lipoprotein-sorting protein